MSGFPARQRDWESPGNLALRASRVLITGLPEGWGTRDFSLGGHKQNFACTKTQRRGAVIPKETEPRLPARVGGLPVGVWVSRGSPQGQRHWKVPLGINPLGLHH